MNADDPCKPGGRDVNQRLSDQTPSPSDPNSGRGRALDYRAPMASEESWRPGPGTLAFFVGQWAVNVAVALIVTRLANAFDVTGLAWVVAIFWSATFVVVASVLKKETLILRIIGAAIASVLSVVGYVAIGCYALGWVGLCP